MHDHLKLCQYVGVVFLFFKCFCLFYGNSDQEMVKTICMKRGLLEAGFVFEGNVADIT